MAHIYNNIDIIRVDPSYITWFLKALKFFL